MVWSVSREVVPRHRQLPLGDTLQSEMDGSSHCIPLPKRSREVVFTSSTVTSVTLHRMIWMITNENREYNALFGRHCFFFCNEKSDDLDRNLYNVSISLKIQSLPLILNKAIEASIFFK
jgi:hypothetical protein